MAYIVTSCFPLIYLLGRFWDDPEKEEYDTQKWINAAMELFTLAVYIVSWIVLFVYYQ